MISNRLHHITVRIHARPVVRFAGVSQQVVEFSGASKRTTSDDATPPLETTPSKVTTPLKSTPLNEKLISTAKPSYASISTPGRIAHTQNNPVIHHINLDTPTHPRGVFREEQVDDINVLVQNFTAPALAEALRDRETTLQRAAALAFSGDMIELKELLVPFLDENVERRRTRNHNLDLSKGFTRKEIVILQRYIHRMPRHVFHAAERRASVVIPLCNVGGVASVLFERRSQKVRTHKQQVCFPGGMLDEGLDNTIIQTSLREMEEELGIKREKIEVLGILRCNWNEVASMTGIAVTPVIGFIGELNDLVLTPNSDEVEQYFTIPLEDLLDEQKWLTRNFSTPVFTGGPHTIWGLTAYLLEKFLKEVVMKCTTPNGLQTSP